MTYHHKEQYKNYINANVARESFIKESQYMSMRLNKGQATYQKRGIFKEYRRCWGALKKHQLEIMNEYDESLIDHMNLGL